MLISHKHRFIFIKTGKVGGTSLEMALSKFMGDEDVITPLSWTDELDRYRRGFRGAQNFERPLAALRRPKDISQWLRASLRSSLGDGETALRARMGFPRLYRNHMDAASIRAEVGDEIWENYFKFSVERNPWDKTLSQFYWDQKGTKKGLTFRDYVLSGRGLKSDFERYTINGIVAVDHLVRYDNLYAELSSLSQRLRLASDASEVLRGISAKSGYRNKKEIVSHYDAETRRAVDIFCARENRLLGFTFDECA